jgi:hypothetical protein
MTSTPIERASPTACYRYGTAGSGVETEIWDMKRPEDYICVEVWTNERHLLVYGLDFWCRNGETPHHSSI